MDKARSAAKPAIPVRVIAVFRTRDEAGQDLPPPPTGPVLPGAAVREGTAQDREKDHRRNWVTAASLALDLLPDLVAGPVETVLNINAPDVARHRLRGVRRSELACFGQVQMTVAEAGTGFVRTALQQPGEVAQPGTDLAYLAQGYATVTTLRALTETDDQLTGLRAWAECPEGAK